MIRPPRFAPIRLAAALLPLLAACQPAPPEAAPEPVRVESPQLELAVAALPDGVGLADSGADGIRLTAGDGAEIRISVGPVRAGGINLVEVVKQRRDAFEAEGLYFGNRELRTPYGVAFTARGQLAGPAGPVEQTWVYSLHPDGSDRLLTVVYSYPGGGDSQARVDQLLELLGEIEPLPAAG